MNKKFIMSVFYCLVCIGFLSILLRPERRVEVFFRLLLIVKSILSMRLRILKTHWILLFFDDKQNNFERVVKSA